MRDFNFFSSFIESKKASASKYIIIGLISTFIIIIVGGFSYINHKNAIALEEEIKGYKAYLNSGEVIEKVKEVEEKRRKIGVMKKYFEALEKINSGLENTYVVDSELIENIAATFPKELFISSMSITDNIVQMQGISSNRVAIAELQHNLKEIRLIDKVNVGIISEESEESNNFIFNMTCIFKDVKNNEIK